MTTMESGDFRAMPAMAWAQIYKDFTSRENVCNCNETLEIYDFRALPATAWVRIYNDFASNDGVEKVSDGCETSEICDFRALPASAWASIYSAFPSDDCFLLDEACVQLAGPKQITERSDDYKRSGEPLESLIMAGYNASESISAEQAVAEQVEAEENVGAHAAETPAKAGFDHGEESKEAGIEFLLNTCFEDIAQLIDDRQNSDARTHLQALSESFRSFLGVSVAADTPGSACVYNNLEESNQMEIHEFQNILESHFKEMDEIISSKVSQKAQPQVASEESPGALAAEMVEKSCVDEETQKSSSNHLIELESLMMDIDEIVGELGKANEEASPSQSSQGDIARSARSAAQLVAQHGQKAREQVQRSMRYMKEQSESVLQVPTNMQRYALEKTESAFGKAQAFSAAFTARVSQGAQKRFNMAGSIRISQHGGA